MRALIIFLGLTATVFAVPFIQTDYTHPQKVAIAEIDTVTIDGMVIPDTAWVIKFPHIVMDGLKKEHK